MFKGQFQGIQKSLNTPQAGQSGQAEYRSQNDFYNLFVDIYVIKKINTIK